jgi:hypothetical protein
MKNVTISLDEETAAWARVEAAKAGKSLSRYVGDILAQKRGAATDEQPWTVLKRFLDGPGYPGISQDLPTRDELYDDREEELVRRHEYPDLHARSLGGGKTARRR